eukprot:jgi/Chlat1/1238/Chrsp115S01686
MGSLGTLTRNKALPSLPAAPTRLPPPPPPPLTTTTTAAIKTVTTTPTTRTTSQRTPDRPLPPAAASRSSNGSTPEPVEFVPDSHEALVVGEPLNGVNSSQDNVISIDDLQDAQQLALPAFESGLTDDQLRQGAYDLLLACTSGWADDMSIDSAMDIMRVQLEITDSVDALTRKVLSSLGYGRSPGNSPFPTAARAPVKLQMASLRLPLELLCTALPSDFDTYRDFQRWQQGQSNLLLEGLRATAGFSKSTNQVDNAPPSKDDEMIARLWTALERLRACCSGKKDEFRKSEYQAAGARLRVAAAVVAEGNKSTVSGGEQQDDPWLYPYPVSMRMYTVMLQGMFDLLEEEVVIPEAAELLRLALGCWSALRVDAAMHATTRAWVLFRQHTVTSDAGLLQAAQDQLLQDVQWRWTGVNPNGRVSPVNQGASLLPAAKRDWLLLTMQPMLRWATAQLSDYYKNFPKGPDRSFDALVKIAASCARILKAVESDQPQDGQLADLQERAAAAAIVRCIQASLRKCYNKVKAEAKQASHGSQSVLLAKQAQYVVEVAARELQRVTPALQRTYASSKYTAIAALHSAYRQDFEGWLQGLSSINKGVMEALSAAEQFEEDLMALVGLSDISSWDDVDGLNPITPLQVGASVSPLLYQWAGDQVAQLCTWVERALSIETWQPVSPAQRFSASVLRSVDDTLDTVFSLRIRPPAGLVRLLSEGIDGALQAYAQVVVGQCGPAERLKPPLPRLTRFKKGVAAKDMERAAAAGVKLVSPVDTAMTPAEVERIARLTIPNLCTRLNTLQHLATQIPIMDKSTRERLRMQFETSGSASANRDTEALFESASFACERGIDNICNFLGVKVVFYDLRGPILQNLYCGGVTVHDRVAHEVMKRLDSILSEIIDVVSSRLRDRVAEALMQSVLEAWQRVVLNGGHLRFFTMEDAEALDWDLNLIKDFFIADGQGLSEQLVEQASAYAQRMLDTFLLDTDLLIQNYQTAEQAAVSTAISNKIRRAQPGPAPGSKEEIILKVLCHRADRNASKFLKTRFRLPKRDQSPVSKFHKLLER